MGVISHGVGTNAPFNITYTGLSATSLGAVPREQPSDTESTQTKESKSYLLENLQLVPRFNATSYSFTDILQIQFEKLAVNSFSNPLSALHGEKAGFVLTLPDIYRKLMTEISTVILRLPELQGVPGVAERFSVDRLEQTVTGVIAKNAETVCSMVWDMRAGRETEIEFINGYWARRGRELGVSTPVNDRLIEQILELTKERKRGPKIPK